MLGNTLSRALAVLTPSLAFALSAGAQSRALDFSYGLWRVDSRSITWSAGYRMPLVGPIDYSLSLSHLDDHRSPLDRTQTGAELTVGLWRDGSGAYAVGGAGMGMKHYDGNLDAYWSAGAGWAIRALSFLSLAVEGRYRTEDQFTRGFWHLNPSDRRGFTVSAGATLLFAGKGRRAPLPRGFDPPSSGELERAARERGVSRAGSAIAGDVVETALDVMGTPYRWGGDGDNGYDCSGLIQYSYGQHGIILPRASREQARLGVNVDRRIEALHPGDILGFSVEGVGVTHVGLYVGDGRFVHSASGGVKISSLAAIDPDSVWWQRRWTVARRILQ